MLFRINKIYISINIYFFAMIIWVIFFHRVSEFIYCLNALFLHELGHILMIYHLKEKISVFYLIPFGFSCRLKNQSKIRKNKILKIILAGPVMSFTVAGLVFLWTKEFALVNLIIGIFNLIPIGNLDGGRIFRILMQS